MSTLRGLATINLFADDLDAAARWYADLLGVEPYFSRDGYREFRIGDYQHELGIIDRRFASPAGLPGGVIAYWHVDDLEGVFARLLEMGATEHQGIREWGPGFVTASVVDPFGNVLGVMTNKHYLDVLTSSRGAS
ncbi:VOC family protein [Micromonospora sp. NPDC050686]|uniref:VOC family protein n=1 Tax=Micromonospora sp. NPDC050686 TaxID=3154631 RepID=UPI0033F6795B